MADDPTNLPDPSVRDLNQTITRLNALRGEFAKLKRELEDTGTQTIENYKKAAGEATELGRQLDRVLESRKKILSTLNSEIEALEKEAATSSTIEKKQEAQRKLVQKQLELEKEKARQYSDQAEEIDKIVKKQNELNKKVKENTDLQKKLTEEQEKQQKESAKLKENMDAIKGSFSSALSSAKRLASGDIAGGLKGIAGSMFDIAMVMAKQSAKEGGFIKKIIDPVGVYADKQMAKLGKDQASRLAKMSGDTKSVAGAASEAGRAAEAASSSVEAVGTAAEAAAPALEATGAATVATGEAAASAAPAVAEAGAATASMGSSASAAGVSVTGLTVATGGLALAVIAAIAVITLAIGAFVVFAKMIIEFNMEVFNASREIERLTYLSQENSQQILQNANKMRLLGVETKDLVAATQSLQTGFKDFSKQSVDVQRELVETTALFTRAGASIDNITKSIMFMTKAMGEGPSSAAGRLRQLELFARDLSIPFSEVSSNLAENIEFLTKFGNKGIDVFKDLQMITKTTNIEMGRLIAITKQFDTFEGAASAAGKLNAALGGNFLNAMEMITTTDPAQRFAMLREAILASGLAFNEMGYYQQEMIASSAGLESVSELALVMSGNFDLLSDSVKKSAEDHVTLEKRAQRLQSFQDQLKNTFMSLIPAMEGMMPAFDKIAERFTEVLGDPEMQTGLQDIGVTIIDMLPAILQMVEGFAALLKFMIGIAQFGGFIVEILGNLAGAVGGFVSSIMDLKGGTALGYTIQGLASLMGGAYAEEATIAMNENFGTQLAMPNADAQLALAKTMGADLTNTESSMPGAENYMALAQARRVAAAERQAAAREQRMVEKQAAMGTGKAGDVFLDGHKVGQHVISSPMERKVAG